MNTQPRKSNITGILLLALLALALVAACSGGNIDVAVGGVNLSPGSVPPIANSEPVVVAEYWGNVGSTRIRRHPRRRSTPIAASIDGLP